MPADVNALRNVLEGETLNCHARATAQPEDPSTPAPRTRLVLVAALLPLLSIAPAALADDAVPAKEAAPAKAAAKDDGAPHTRKQDVVYGRKHGVALTLDVFTPKKDPNGAADFADEGRALALP